MSFSDKQIEYYEKAHARWNMKIGAVRSGKTYLDYKYIIPRRIRNVRGRQGISLILGVPLLNEYFKTGLVPKFPSLIVSTIFFVITLLMWITGIILTVINKKHKQLYELYMNSIKR